MGSRAIVADQRPAVLIGRAPEYLASGISHQNERMILLVAAGKADTAG
jgi:hypothetical protein